MGRVDVLLGRIVGEYREMPGLKLTRAQASRLWGLEPLECDALFAALLAAGFLRTTDSGAFMWTGVAPPGRLDCSLPKALAS